MTEKSKFPFVAGWKGNKLTGIQAAIAVSKDMGRRHAQVLTAFAPFGRLGATCDEIGEAIGLPAYLVRPRATELEKQGKLFSIGKRMGGMGHKVTVYSTVQPSEPYQQIAA